MLHTGATSLPDGLHNGDHDEQIPHVDQSTSRQEVARLPDSQIRSHVGIIKGLDIFGSHSDTSSPHLGNKEQHRDGHFHHRSSWEELEGGAFREPSMVEKLREVIHHRSSRSRSPSPPPSNVEPHPIHPHSPGLPADLLEKLHSLPTPGTEKFLGSDLKATSQTSTVVTPRNDGTEEGNLHGKRMTTLPAPPHDKLGAGSRREEGGRNEEGSAATRKANQLEKKEDERAKQAQVKEGGHDIHHGEHGSLVERVKDVVLGHTPLGRVHLGHNENGHGQHQQQRGVEHHASRPHQGDETEGHVAGHQGKGGNLHDSTTTSGSSSSGGSSGSSSSYLTSTFLDGIVGEGGKGEARKLSVVGTGSGGSLVPTGSGGSGISDHSPPDETSGVYSSSGISGQSVSHDHPHSVLEKMKELVLEHTPLGMGHVHVAHKEGEGGEGAHGQGTGVGAGIHTHVHLPLHPSRSISPNAAATAAGAAFAASAPAGTHEHDACTSFVPAAAATAATGHLGIHPFHAAAPSGSGYDRLKFGGNQQGREKGKMQGRASAEPGEEDLVRVQHHKEFMTDTLKVPQTQLPGHFPSASEIAAHPGSSGKVTREHTAAAGGGRSGAEREDREEGHVAREGHREGEKHERGHSLLGRVTDVIQSVPPGGS